MFLSFCDIIICLEFNRAQDIISENKQTVVKRNLLTSLQLFWLLARRDTVVSKEKPLRAELRSKKLNQQIA